MWHEGYSGLLSWGVPVKRIQVGIIVFDGFSALDVTGPMDSFAAAGGLDGDQTGSCYEVFTVAKYKRPVTSESGMVVQPARSFAECGELDTVFVPGGAALRDPAQSAPITQWIKANEPRFRRIASVCTGIYGLAQTGLLNERKVTTHWRFAADLASRYPRLNVNDDAIFLKDGKFYTSAGVTSGIDLSLAMIEEDLGRKVALSVARELVVYTKRAGGQAQYSEPLKFQTDSGDAIAEVAQWIGGHLTEDLSVQELAYRSCLSERQFSRRFLSAFHVTPAQFVERARLDAARERLAEFHLSVESIARSVGFQSDDSFRRAFERHFGLAPTQYRQRFHSPVSLSRGHAYTES